jgi:hypothetical protein
MRTFALALLFAVAGCKATFVDERIAGVGAALPDAGGCVEHEQRTGSIARGTFNGIGHVGRGGVELFAVSDGAWELRFDDSFLVTDVPGPVVLLTSHDKIGINIDPAADEQLGPLQRVTGAQVYAFDQDPCGRRNVFVFCEPFGIEVAEATLVEVAP